MRSLHYNENDLVLSSQPNGTIICHLFWTSLSIKYSHMRLFWYRKAGIGCICLQVSLCIRDGMPSENSDDLSLGLYLVKVIEIYQAKCIARIVILIRAVA